MTKDEEIRHLRMENARLRDMLAARILGPLAAPPASDAVEALRKNYVTGKRYEDGDWSRRNIEAFFEDQDAALASVPEPRNDGSMLSLWHLDNWTDDDFRAHIPAVRHTLRKLWASVPEPSAEVERLREALKPFAGDRMPSLKRSEIGYDRDGLRRCISPMELAMVEARAALNPQEASR